MRRVPLAVRRGLPLAGACALTAAFAIGAPSASAQTGLSATPQPNTGGVNAALAFPAFSPSQFQTPNAALRPKYRWWQPVAYTNDSEIQRELGNVAADFGGGLEQNGFPVSMNSSGASSQFSTFANSQQFGQMYGWGSPLWSHRTEVYQVAAAMDGVIGDMNEGSRWNNTAPDVWSPNQPGDAMDLDGNFRQYQAGQSPNGELPQFASPAQTGESTRLTVDAPAGSSTLYLQSIAGLLTGDQVTVGAGNQTDFETITSIGTPSDETGLTEASSTGSSVVHVAEPPTASGLVAGSQASAQFVAGESVTVGQGPTAESDVISNIGTFDIATAPTAIDAPPGSPSVTSIPAGTNNVQVASASNFLTGDTISFSNGESATIASVGGAGSGTTLSSAVGPGSLQITVASASGLSAGQWIVLSNVAAPWVNEVDRIATISGTTLTLYTPLANGYPGSANAPGTAVYLQSLGVTFTPALASAITLPATAIDRGTGITLQTQLQNSHPIGDQLLAAGTGVQVSPALTHSHYAGSNTRVATTLSANTAVGATNIQVASINSVVVGDKLTVGQAGYYENVTVTAVGTAGATGSGLSISPALSLLHYSGDPVVDVSPRSASTTLAAGATAGASAIDVVSAAGFTAGSAITIDQGSASYGETQTIASIGAGGAGPGASTVITLAGPLGFSHSGGAPVYQLVSTTLASAASSGATNITVASATGIGVNDSITIDSGATNAETKSVTAISGNTLTVSALANSHNAGAAVVDNTNPGAVGSGGLNDEEIETPVAVEVEQCLAPGVADQDVAATTTVFTPTAGSVPTSGNNVKVTSTTGLAVGDVFTVGTGAGAQSTTITAVGTQGRNTTLSATAASGATNVSVTSATGLAVGDTLTIAGTPNATETIVSVAGSTVGISPALTTSYPGGSAVSDNGSGITVANSLSGITSGESVYDTCTSAASGGTRELDPTSYQNVTSQASPNPATSGNPANLNWAAQTLAYTNNGGVLPTGGDTYTPPGGASTGMPWELMSFNEQGDSQTNAGGTATTPNQWLGHLSAAAADAMTSWFDNDILNDPATQAAIDYEDQHNGTPAAFEDSIENSSNINWLPNMITQWQSDLGYDVTPLLPVLLGTGRDATSASPFDFPQSDTGTSGATLGWRTRDDYGYMFNYLYTHSYTAEMQSWATAHGLVFRTQAYGDPIDDGEQGAYVGIPEGEHFEFDGDDEVQQFKVIASGAYQANTPHFVSDECCEANAEAWADPFGVDGTGSGSSPGATQANGISDYLDQVGGVTQIIYHGWPYTVGAPGSAALWPGNTYGGDTSFAAGNGPNQPQFADDRNNNVNVARRDLLLRQGEPVYDVAVFHQDYGLSAQGQDSLAGGWAQGSVVQNGTSLAVQPQGGKVLRSSSSLSQAGYLYDPVSPADFTYPDASYAVDPANEQYLTTHPSPDDNSVLFPGHGDYRSLMLYDQSTLPVYVAQKLVTLAGEGLPIVIVGPVPSAASAGSPSGGSIATDATEDQAVQAAMAQVVAAPHTVVVSDLAATGSQSNDGNAPAALTSLGIAPSAQINSNSAVTGSGTAQPILAISRFDPTTGTYYYQLDNMDQTATAIVNITLTGNGTPQLISTFGGAITPIANYSAVGDRETMTVRIGAANAIDIAISDSDLSQSGGLPAVHATSTTANATAEGADNVLYNSAGQLVARAASTGNYATTLSDGTAVISSITAPATSQITGTGVSTTANAGKDTLTDWNLWVDSWTQTPSGDPTINEHSEIPACSGASTAPGVTSGTILNATASSPFGTPILGQPTISNGSSEIPASPPSGDCNSTFAVTPLTGATNGALPWWPQITPQATPSGPAFAWQDNLTNVAGIGVYSTSFTLPANWSSSSEGLYLNVGAAVDTVDVWVNNQNVPVDENDRNQIDIGPWLVPGANTLTISVATPLRNAVAVAPSTPATGQVPNSSETIGTLQGGSKIADTGLAGPVTLTPYGQSGPLETNSSSSSGGGSASVTPIVSGSVGGGVPDAVSLSLSSLNVSFGSFNPNAGTTTYNTTVAASVSSTAGGTALTVNDPDGSSNSGHLENGAYALAQPLQASASDTGGQGGVSSGWNAIANAPSSLLSWGGPVRNDTVTIGLQQTIGANEALRAGTYSKAITFTVAVTTP